MKRYLFFLPLLLLVMACNCNCDKGKKEVCVIQGTANPRFNGTKIFLVPMMGPQDAAHVDSVVITNGEFSFEKDTIELAVLRVDYHVRLDVQDLLVVTEPGVVTVVIDTISDGYGTPQNDSLSRWKSLTTAFNISKVEHTRAIRAARDVGDTVLANALQAEIDTISLQYKRRTRQLTDNLGEGVLHDFLQELYPKTYQRRLPDGSIVTVDADTHEVLMHAKGQ